MGTGPHNSSPPSPHEKRHHTNPSPPPPPASPSPAFGREAPSWLLGPKSIRSPRGVPGNKVLGPRAGGPGLTSAEGENSFLESDRQDPLRREGPHSPEPGPRRASLLTRAREGLGGFVKPEVLSLFVAGESGRWGPRAKGLAARQQGEDFQVMEGSGGGAPSLHGLRMNPINTEDTSESRTTVIQGSPGICQAEAPLNSSSGSQRREEGLCLIGLVTIQQSKDS